ncbi:MAG: FO synthase subunit 2 [Methanoregulaceae archaeon PtaB.Bin009]|jgi:FO synthase subunit 2|nr:MAG: FO synthase subunit 2 [Methanoregulaceae archaeon PtaB.Bin009]OPY41284.1 MAG: FO synthase subunit 2 [Methanoregulaceae archaeon PtaU1.Bin066]
MSLSMDLRTLLSDARAGHRLDREEALFLLNVKGREVFQVCSAADQAREEMVGPVITYVRNQNLHLSNICKNLCGFCAFGRSATDEGAFCDDRDTVGKKVRLALDRKVSEICLLSGVNPEFDAARYLEILSWVKEVAPEIHVHAFSPDEVSHAATRSGLSTREVLLAMKAAGLGSLQGTAAEILVDRVREIICPAKVPTDEWVRIIREAHGLGIPTTATIMYGSCETPRDRIAHLSILRDIQDGTGGFSELVPLSYLHQNTRLYVEGKAPPGATGREDLLLIAVSRLFLDNFKNIQVSWGKLGVKLGQVALLAGANDLAGTMFSDDVSGDAGASGSDFLDPREMERMVADIGRVLRRRLTDYRLADDQSPTQE